MNKQWQCDDNSKYDSQNMQIRSWKKFKKLIDRGP